MYKSEINVMEIVWEKAPISAKDISLIAANTIGWNKNTTYTVIKKLVAKGIIRREEPGFICTPLISREEMQKNEVSSLLNNIFNGSRKALFSALINNEEMTEADISDLKKMINKR